MRDSLDRFLQDLHFEPPAGLVQRAKHAAAAQAFANEDDHVGRVRLKARLGFRAGLERQREPKLLTVVAALLAGAILATLAFTAWSFRSRPIAPANHVAPVASVRPDFPPALALPKTGALDPISYYLANPNADSTGRCMRACSAYRQIIFTLPAGWSTKDGLVYKHFGEAGEVAFSAWAVRDVFDDPCHWQRSTLSPIDITHQTGVVNGAVVLAPYVGGLAHQALRGPVPRAITPLTFATFWPGGSGRVTALQIDLSVPAQLDLSTCDGGQFRSWPVAYSGSELTSASSLAEAGANFHHVSGQLDSAYMINVDGSPLVIDASHMPSSSLADLAELKSIVASMVIDQGF